MRRFLGAMDHIVATSPNYFAASEELARCKEKVCVIPIGIDKDSYPTCSDEKVQVWRSQFGPVFCLCRRVTLLQRIAYSP